MFGPNQAISYINDRLKRNELDGGDGRRTLLASLGRIVNVLHKTTIYVSTWKTRLQRRSHFFFPNSPFEVILKNNLAILTLFGYFRLTRSQKQATLLRPQLVFMLKHEKSQ